MKKTLLKILTCFLAFYSTGNAGSIDLYGSNEESAAAPQKISTFTEADRVAVIRHYSEENTKQFIGFNASLRFHQNVGYYCEGVGNSFLYLSSTLGMLGQISSLTFPNSSNYLNWGGSACACLHFMLLGVANFSSRKVTEKQDKINKYLDQAEVKKGNHNTRISEPARGVDLTPQIYMQTKRPDATLSLAASAYVIDTHQETRSSFSVIDIDENKQNTE